MRVKSIKPAGKADCFCLTVQDNDHSFVVNQHFVVINSLEAWGHFLMSRPQPGKPLGTNPEYMSVEWARKYLKEVPD